MANQKDSRTGVAAAREITRPRIDYSQRNRTLEFRSQWLHLNRPFNDLEYIRFREDAFRVKLGKIERQRQTAGHMAAYDPAGAGSPWFSLGPRNVNGRVRSIAVHPADPSTVYAGAASGGVWKSTDGGLSWRPLWDNQESLAIGAVAIASSSPNTIYVGTGEGVTNWGATFPGSGVYVSTDGGGTWSQRASAVNRRITQLLVSHTDPTHLYVAGPSGFERSIDSGSSWTTLKTGTISDAAMDPNDPNVLYIGIVNDGIWKSTDGGANFSKLNNAPSGASATWPKISIGKNGAHGSNFLVVKNGTSASVSTDGGANWTTLAGLGAAFVGWCDLIAVAPNDENIILAGGVGLQRSSTGGASWVNSAGLHSDQHQAFFAPSNTNIVYVCNDGGVYRSDDKGLNWQDISNGMVITQFYNVGAWNPISNVLGGGTQDQGTNVTTGGLTWKEILGNDGGYLLINPSDPHIMYAESQNTAIEKSTDGGNTWVGATAGLSGSTPFVGTMTMDPNAPNTLFAGTSRVFRTLDGVTTPWAASSQDLGSFVSAITVAPSDSSRVYAGTGDVVFRNRAGTIHRSDDGGATSPWADKTGTLPSSRPVMSIAVDRANRDRVAVCYGATSGGSSNHVFLSTTGGDSWTDISGDLPDISANAVAFDPNNPNTLYVGTDVGLYRTTNLGTNWQAFDNGIPNVVITDLLIDAASNIMYAASFGRGMYKLNITPAITLQQVDLYLRDDILDTGERFPSPSDQPDPIDPSDRVYWWESPDIKVNAPPYYVPPAVFDGVNFDQDLVHQDPIRTQVNRFYLQVHNRGWQTTNNVRVRAFFADAHAGLPPLPNALTPPDFNLTSTTDWQPVGPAQTISSLEPNRPVIVSWDWTVPPGAATHSCLLAVVSSPDDPMSNAQTDVNVLVDTEKHVCLKNLHVIDSAGPVPEQTLVTINFHNSKDKPELIDIVVDPTQFQGGTIGVLFEPIEFADKELALFGVSTYPLREGEDIGKIYVHPRSHGAPQHDVVSELERKTLRKLDHSVLYEFDSVKVSELRGVKIGARQTIHAAITCKGSANVPYGTTQQFSVLQRQGGRIVGGCTYEVRLTRAAGLLPVSHIRVLLESLHTEHPLKGGKELAGMVSFNNDRFRRHLRPLPFKIGKEEICLFDGYVAQRDNIEISLVSIEDERSEPVAGHGLYGRHFNGPPETWVGEYASEEEGLKIRFRVESVPLTADETQND